MTAKNEPLRGYGRGTEPKRKDLMIHVLWLDVERMSPRSLLKNQNVRKHAMNFKPSFLLLDDGKSTAMKEGS